LKIGINIRLLSTKSDIINEQRFASEVLKKYPPNKIFYIPVRLDDCEIPYRELKPMHRADLFPVWKEGLQKILRAIGVAPAVVEDKESAIELERTKRIIEFRGYDETRIFVGNIWNLRIRNRLSNSVNDCKAEARIFHNGMDIGDKFDLPWMPFDRLPTTCQDASNNEREFASSYIGELFGRLNP
jgi:hypothetical protein